MKPIPLTLALALLLLLLLAPGAAARTLVDEGPLLVTADIEPQTGCDVGLDDEVCAGRHDTNGTATPGDDELAHNLTIHNVAVHYRESPGGLTWSQTVRPDDLVLHHPVWTQVHGAYLLADGETRGTTQDHATIEGEAFPDPDPNDGLDVSTWGYRLHAHPADTEERQVWLLCHDLTCGRIWWGFFESRADGIHFAAFLGSAAEWESDPYVEGIVPVLTSCLSVWREIGCPEEELALIREHAMLPIDAVQNATPNLRTYFQVESATVSVGGA